MIFTSAKALQYISIPTYTIFKNLTIILIAYGEVLWFGGSVTGLALLSFGLMVLSSVVSAWADISAALGSYSSAPHEAATELASLNAGYIWMLANCLSSATFVLSMRKRIKLTQFSDFVSVPPRSQAPLNCFKRAHQMYLNDALQRVSAKRLVHRRVLPHRNCFVPLVRSRKETGERLD